MIGSGIGILVAVGKIMLATLTSAGSLSAGENHRSEDRRRNPRYTLCFSAFVWVPSLGKDWARSKTINVSTGGAALETGIAVLPDSPIEYILTFPSELTHAAVPLHVRFCGRVIRVESRGENEGHCVAVQSTSYKYLPRGVAETFAAFDRPLPQFNVELQTG